MKTINRFFLGIMMVLVSITAGIASTGNGSEIEGNLFTAIQNIDYVSINVLLAEGADVDTVNEQGDTPLMLAAKIGNPRIVDILLSHDPDVNRQNDAGMTTLMIAARSGQAAIVAKLLNHGADKGIKGPNGNTALMLASKYGHQNVVKLLTDTAGNLTR